MKKRIIAIMCLMMVLWCSNGFASEAKWELVDTEGIFSIYLDVNSVKTVTVGFGEFAKGTYKDINNENSDYTLTTVLINKDTKEHCVVSYENYKGNIKSGFNFTNDPKDPDKWHITTLYPIHKEILKRAN